MDRTHALWNKSLGKAWQEGTQLSMMQEHVYVTPMARFKKQRPICKHMEIADRMESYMGLLVAAKVPKVAASTCSCQGCCHSKHCTTGEISINLERFYTSGCCFSPGPFSKQISANVMQHSVRSAL
jgi:hypothetical protein